MDNKKKLRLKDDDLKDLSIAEKKLLFSKNVFIAEDLTPFRAHIFKYIRDWNNEKKIA